MVMDNEMVLINNNLSLIDEKNEFNSSIGLSKSSIGKLPRNKQTAKFAGSYLQFELNQ